jgi:hypothetical protein
MRNALIMGLLVVLMWLGVEVATKGLDRAWGGIFVTTGLVEAPPPEKRPGAVAERAAGAQEGAYDRGQERVDRQLESADQ